MTDETNKNNIEDDAAEISPSDVSNDVELVADEEYGLPTEQVGDETGVEALKKLRAKLKESQMKCNEYMTGWQRAKADYVNARRQNDEERAEFLKYSERRLMSELLMLADSFDLALSETSGTPPNSEKWLVGIKNIRAQLEKILASHGVKTMETQTGKRFDPALHEALISEPVADETQDDIVLTELTKGYMIHDQVLRPAQVKVGEYKQNN